MNLTETLLSGEIESIDFDLEIDCNRFAQTTILKSSPRCKVYYCFKNDDTREDGEDRCSIETHNEICSSLATLLSDSINVGNTNVKYSLVITSTHKTKHSFNNQGLSPQVIKAIVNLLTNHIDEFTFLTAFTHFI